MANLLCLILPAILVTSLALVNDNAGAGAAAPQQKTQAPASYRMMLGAFEVTVLSDGTHPFPNAAVLTTPASRESPTRVKLFRPGSTEANRLLRAADLTIPTEGSINAFLINTGTKLILIDSGAGSLYGPCCGHLLSNLRASGYRPEQIDDVFLTHLHEDYVGGIAPGGTMAFSNANVYASKADADYWLNDAHERAAPTFLDGQFEGAKHSLLPYRKARRFKTFVGAAELYPGIRAIPAPGHTPGHTFYQVESQTHRLLIWGDVVHVAALQFPDPSIGTEYDTDPTQAEETRLKVFAKAKTDGVLIGAMHVSFPGLGHVGQSGTSFFRIPAEYSARL